VVVADDRFGVDKNLREVCSPRRPWGARDGGVFGRGIIEIVGHGRSIAPVRRSLKAAIS
jgi:hypothetical protein